MSLLSVVTLLQHKIISLGNNKKSLDFGRIQNAPFGQCTSTIKMVLQPINTFMKYVLTFTKPIFSGDIVRSTTSMCRSLLGFLGLGGEMFCTCSCRKWSLTSPKDKKDRLHTVHTNFLKCQIY